MKASPWHVLAQLPAWLLLWLQLAVLGLVSLAWNMVALLLHPLLGVERGRRVGRAAIAWAYRSYWGFTSAFGLLRLELDALAPLAGDSGLVVVANHPSLLDAMLLVARLPRALCIMKASLLANPFLGAGAALARYIPNDSVLTMVRRAVAELRAGGQLVMFPEGTRTTTPPLDPMHASFAFIAKHARVPIQTVFIDTRSPYLGKGWPLWRLPPLPICFAVRLGRRFEPRADHEALTREIEAYYRADAAARAAPLR